ncbi:PilC/PilY family type IV pilus protein [Marinobacter sp. ATCH36]|uniref:pilus assembly protein n=1 Tax=Marinobacter sp. ATCH36 TaxID=2945106 RepID=UPI0020217ADB|nr:PilC/PilY family type IV pilus protein [Marinobacter sp. ATCH36]MCL7945875.1 PilC/PilY family type IV pilus protein [Marinobacter sp. ATCH36]
MLKNLKFRMLAVGMALVLPTSGWAEVNFSQKPLSAGGGVDPNLMFILDDSGSMRWGFMPDELMGGRNLGDCPSYVSYGGDGYCAMNVGNRSPLLSPTFNKLYYNPNVTYAPPLDEDGQYPDADFYNAPINGFDSGSARLNLDTSYRAIMDDYYYYGQWSGNRIYGFTLSPFANASQAFYLDWRQGCDPSNFNCYDQIFIDSGVERKNFANWFSYYRTREMSAKSGIGTVFANKDLSLDFRLGWGLINQGRNNVDDAANVRGVEEGVRPFADVRSDFLAWLYDSNAGGSTPLQRALEGAGQYYEKSKRAWLDDPSTTESSDNVARECRISATMLMTDGYYNTGNSYDPDLDNYADDIPGSVIANGTGDSGQYLAEQPFSDGLTGRVTLGDIAAYYWKRDLREDIDNYVPTIDPVIDSGNDGVRQTVGDSAFWQHMMTYGIGFGVEGTVSRDEAVDAVINGEYVDWWGGSTDEDKINDLLHASMNGRGDFFSAGDPSTFRNELENLLAQFLGNAGSATGLDFNVASIDAVDAALSFSSYFDPNGWSGDLEAITLVANDSGRPDQADPDSDGWSAREKLEGIDFDSRTVLTYNGDTGVPFRWANLTDAQEEDLEVGDASLAQLRVEYLRGKRKATIEAENSGQGKFFRDRASLLGAIVNSTPRYVGVPDSAWPNTDDFGDGNYTVFRNSNLDRDPVVYVGANDGMLHGFSAKSGTEGGGQEVLAYVPSFVSSTEPDEGLHYLTQPGYDHRYYVDLNLEVVDVHTKGRKADGTGVDNTREWRTVLIGGSRAGAKGIFALDVTDPDEFSEDNAAKSVLWEFTHPDLGYLVEPPEIAQMEWPDGNIRWTVFVPSGYNSDTTGFFMLDLEAGLDGEWSTGDYLYHEFDNAGTGLSPLTVVDNVNDDYLVDRVYAGDLEGNMWVAYNDEGTMTTAYTSGGADVPYFKASQPITSAPGVGLGLGGGKDPNIMILFGTGKYLENGDVSDTSAQYFYSVHETSDAGGLPLTIANLVEAPVASQSGNIDGATRDIRVESNNRVDYETKQGWYTPLPTSGERIVNYPIVRGEYVYVNTLIPGANPCLGGGDGWVMGFEILRSDDSTPSYPAFENSTDGASGFRVGSTPSQLAVWGNLLTFGTGSGGAEFIGLPEIVIGLGRKGWREMTE